MQWVVASMIAALAQGQPAVTPAIEIEASLSGYNLLWPSQRCCSFELKLARSGKVTVVVNVNNRSEPVERRRTFQLNSAQLHALKDAIARARFFELPRAVGTTPVDGDMRKVRIRVGDKSHHVEIGESALSSALTAELARAAAVWRAIRDLVPIPESTVR
jgi:hypothetical protein